MKKELAAAIAVCSLATSLPLPAQDADDQLDELETVVIVGGYAAPRLWKVSKGDHVMWVLGNTGPAPAGVQWRTEEMETHIAESQQVLFEGWGKTSVDIGILKALTLLPAAFKAAKNPDNKTLKDVLPADTYARWRVLKMQYVGRDNDIEKWRPSIAIGMLEKEVRKKSVATLTVKPADRGPSIRSLVDKAATKHKVKTRTMPIVEREIKVKNAREILKSAYHLDLGDLQCFTHGLEYLERLVEYTKQNTAALPSRVSCDDALIKGLRSGEIPDPAGALKVLDEVELQAKLGREQLDAEWMAAAQAAIAKNMSTFAVLRMSEVTGSSSYLEKLRQLGYKVEDPN